MSTGRTIIAIIGAGIVLRSCAEMEQEIASLSDRVVFIGLLAAIIGPSLGILWVRDRFRQRAQQGVSASIASRSEKRDDDAFVASFGGSVDRRTAVWCRRCIALALNVPPERILPTDRIESDLERSKANRSFGDDLVSELLRRFVLDPERAKAIDELLPTDWEVSRFVTVCHNALADEPARGGRAES